MKENALMQGPWTRSANGWIAGVCEGLSHQFGVSAGLLRLVWLGSILFFGFGFLLYLGLAFALPREDDHAAQTEGRFLGVCQRISVRANLDVGLVRILALILLVSSFGATFVGYIILHFVLEDKPRIRSSSEI